MFSAPAVSETKQALTEDLSHGYFVDGEKASMCLNATLLSLGGPKAKAAQWWALCLVSKGSSLPGAGLVQIVITDFMPKEAFADLQFCC